MLHALILILILQACPLVHPSALCISQPRTEERKGLRIICIPAGEQGVSAIRRFALQVMCGGLLLVTGRVVALRTMRTTEQHTGVQRNAQQIIQAFNRIIPPV